MASNTAFGPQGANASTSIPATRGVNRYGTGVDTWVKDASSASANDGTILDDNFFNMILGNLRQLVKDANTDGAGIVVGDGDFTLVSQAVQFYASQAVSASLVSPAAFLSAVNFTPAPAADRLTAYDASAGVSGYVTPYQIVNSALKAGSGVTLTQDNINGTVEITAGTGIEFGGLSVSGGTIALDDLIAFKDVDTVSGTHKTITYKQLRDLIVASTLQLPVGGTGYLEKDSSGNLSWTTPANTFPANNVGQLTNDGSGTLTYVQTLPLSGGTMTGNVDFVDNILRLGRIPITALPAAGVSEGAIVYGTGMSATAGYDAGPIYCDGTNWRKVMNDIIVA